MTTMRTGPRGIGAERFAYILRQIEKGGVVTAEQAFNAVCQSIAEDRWRKGNLWDQMNDLRNAARKAQANAAVV